MPGGVYGLMKSRFSQPTASDGMKATVKSEEQMEEMDLEAVAAAIQGEVGNGWFDEAESTDLQEPEQDSDKQGLQGIMNWLTTTAGEDKSSYVTNFVENLPLRAQLFSAYLIENGTDISDLQSDRKKLSDTMAALQSYTPDYEKFVDQMTASKFKFWKHIAGSQIYWDKFAKAARFARAAVESEAQQAEQQAQGGGGAATVPPDQASGTSGEQDAAQTPAASGGDQDIPAAVRDRSAPILAMHRAFQEAQRTGFQIGGHRRAASPEPDAASATPEAASATPEAASGASTEQSTGDSSSQQVPSEARRPARPSRDAVSEAVHEERTSASETQKSIFGYGSMAMSALSGGAGAVGTAAGMLGNSAVSPVTDALSSPLKGAGGIMTMAEKGIAAYQGIQDIRTGSYTGAEAAERGLGVGATALGALKEGAGAAVNISKTIGTLAPSGSSLASGAATAAGVAGTVGTALGVGVGAFNLASGGVGLVSHLKHQKDIQAQMEQYRGRSDVSAQEKNQFEQISRIALTSERMAAVSSGFKAASGAAALAGGIVTLTGVGAGIGGILGGLSTGINVVGKIVSYLAFRGRKKEAIDRFINLNRMVAKLKSNAATKDMKIDEDKVRSSFIQTLGYISVDDMYEDLIWQFATLMHENGVEGDDPAYITLLANMGLKVNKSAGKPVPAQIAKKLKG